MVVKGIMQYNTRTIGKKLIIFGSVCCSCKTGGRGGEVVQSERAMSDDTRVQVQCYFTSTQSIKDY